MTIRTLFIAVVLAAAGCGKSTTDVSGTVKFEGKTVVFGTVVIVGSDGVSKSGPIQPDGTFTVSGVRTGTAKVYVSSPKPPGLTPPPKPKATGRDAGADERRPADANETMSPEVLKGWFPLPEKLGDPALSDHTIEVVPGQPLDLDLK